MGRRRRTIRRKLRTRDHIIADLAVNHVERQVLLAGYTLEEMHYDYGIDLVMFLFGPSGEMANGLIFFQVKGAERATRVSDGREISCRLDRADLLQWRNEQHPVILVVYDVGEDRAWWLHIQGYLRARPRLNLFEAGKTIRVRVPTSQVLTPDAARQISALWELENGEP